MKYALIAVVSLLLPAMWFTAGGDDVDATSFSPVPREQTVEKYSNWMARLPDDVLLPQLSIPGTHDSCALRDGASFGFAKCQSWRLADQLRAGIRFIDIRCRHVGDEFLIYHGIIDQHMTFSEVRDVCRAFLEKHPTESIVMSVKSESTPKGNSRAFKATFGDVIREDKKLWHIRSAIPKLRDVRGRIVLIDRVGSLGGFPWGKMKRQDDYQAEVSVKSKLIRSHLTKATKSNDREWFINFCSGTLPAALITPRGYATQSNKVALEYLSQPALKSPSRVGTIVMDFPGEGLIERIVELNFTEPK